MTTLELDVMIVCYIFGILFLLGVNMKGNFERALAMVLRHEGGFVNHPNDPGGMTNKGITKKVYDAFMKR